MQRTKTQPNFSYHYLTIFIRVSVSLWCHGCFSATYEPNALQSRQVSLNLVARTSSNKSLFCGLSRSTESRCHLPHPP